MDETTRLRNEMVTRQIERRGVRDPRVLDAMRTVPRHLFVPEASLAQAYADGPLPIGQGQTISQPYMVAVMSALLELNGDETVLEVGTGSGYQAAVLARLCRRVVTVERHAGLAEKARRTLAGLSVDNVEVQVGDGSLGCVPFAPYGGIVVTAAAPAPPAALLDQLQTGRYLVIPVGGHGGQDLQRWEKTDRGAIPESFFPVSFVPLRGDAGWSETDW